MFEKFGNIVFRPLRSRQLNSKSNLFDQKLDSTRTNRLLICLSSLLVDDVSMMLFQILPKISSSQTFLNSEIIEKFGDLIRLK